MSDERAETEFLEWRLVETDEIIKHLREYLKVMKDEPEGYIKLSKMYHDLKRILGDE